MGQIKNRKIYHFGIYHEHFYKVDQIAILVFVKLHYYKKNKNNELLIVTF